MVSLLPGRHFTVKLHDFIYIYIYYNFLKKLWIKLKIYINLHLSIFSLYTD